MTKLMEESSDQSVAASCPRSPQVSNNLLKEEHLVLVWSLEEQLLSIFTFYCDLNFE